MYVVGFDPLVGGLLWEEIVYERKGSFSMSFLWLFGIFLSSEFLFGQLSFRNFIRLHCSILVCLHPVPLSIYPLHKHTSFR